MITDHVFLPGVGNFCIHASQRQIKYGVKLREPCLKPREDHQHRG